MLYIFRALTALLAPVLLAASGQAAVAAAELDVAKAAVLGVIEGVTEFLPVSSTGHLLVAQELMGIGDTDATEDAADTYAITIQTGAILAVLLLYAGRVRAMGAGIVGRDATGRHVFVALAIAFLPAALVGFVADDALKDALFGPIPITIAWAVGGVVILLAARWLRRRGPGQVELDAIPLRTALMIGVAQVAALWPGTSRSLVTILAALALGLSVTASLEFSFLLGLATLGAATGYEAVRNGAELFDTYGTAELVVGFVTAFVAALIAVRWLVGYLDRHGLALFGWYRLGIAAVAAVLLATGTL